MVAGTKKKITKKEEYKGPPQVIPYAFNLSPPSFRIRPQIESAALKKCNWKADKTWNTITHTTYVVHMYSYP